MTVHNLNRDQLIELKQAMLCEIDSPSYGELAEADSIVSDKDVFAYVGTLYMGDEPVRIQDSKGKPANYHRSVGSLRIGPVLEDPAYRVVGIRTGDILIADRGLLRKISYRDIQRMGLDARY